MRVVVPVQITDNGEGVFQRATTGTYFDGGLVMHTAAIDEPRFNREPGGGVVELLLEPAATNLSGYSERVDQWTPSGATVTTNALTAPDENNTADKLVENSSNSAHYVDGPVFTISAGQAFSVQLFMAQGGRSYARVEIRNVNGTTSAVAQSFLISASFLIGPTAKVGGANVGTIRRPLIVSPWQRFSFENVTLAGDVTQAQVRVYIQDFADLTDANANSTTVTYTGDGTSGLGIWGLDAKVGAELSSYIATPTSATVTRAADTYGNMMVSNVAESEAVYSSGTTYASGARVRGNTDATAHTLYESLEDTNNGHPLSDVDWWFPLGPTNRWAPFDLSRSTGATAPSPMYYAVTPYQDVDTAAFTNVIADRYTIEVKDGDGVTIYSDSGELDSRRPASKGSFQLPEAEDVTITLTLERDDGDVTLGAFDVGVSYDLGEATEGAEVGALNFSKIERDDFGNLPTGSGGRIGTKRRSVPTLSVTTFAEKDLLGDIVLARDLLNATVGLWFTIEDDDHPYFGSTFIRGIYRRFSSVLAVNTIMTNLELEEV